MISFDRVSKSYSGHGVRKKIIEGFTFTFPTGRNVAILGSNGVGKSTLMRLMSGAELPDYGRVTRVGRVSWPVGFSAGFNGSMTGIENIRFVARIYGQDTEEVTEFVRSFSELGSSIGLPVKNYSSGMKARLGIGMSMALNFDYYLVDEVIAVGDASFKQKTRNMFRAKLEKSNMFMISHSMRQVREYCDCGIHMTKGCVAYYDNVDELIAAYEGDLA